MAQVLEVTTEMRDEVNAINDAARKQQAFHNHVFTKVSKHEALNDDEIKDQIIKVVRKVIGPIAKPDKIQIVSGLPKTRSGKIMRRILRKVASNDFKNLGDTSTLLNPDVVKEIIDGAII